MHTEGGVTYLTNDTGSAKVEDAVTGQKCDHIVGFILSDYPQYGENDRLARESEGVSVSEMFSFCPLCGDDLLPPKTPGLPVSLEMREHPRLIGEWLRFLLG